MVQGEDPAVGVRERAHTALYFVNRRAPMVSWIMNWKKQAKKVKKTEQILNLYLQVPANMKTALTKMTP